MNKNELLYMGMDVGGTKIQTSLVGESGVVYASNRTKTPRGCASEVTIQAMKDSIDSLLAEQSLSLSDLAAVGIAIPGVVEPATGNIVVTPNMNLTGVPLGEMLSRDLGVPIAIGNDGNLGTLGETWLGAARNSNSTVGIFVGTGVGSGLVLDGKLWSGAGYAAGEIGHMVVQTPAVSWKEALGLKPHDAERDAFPVCGCGNIGCLESFASRTAIENALREAIALGVPSCITELAQGDLSVIRSGMLSKALKAGDALVTAVVENVAQVLAYAVRTVRHLLDPEVILFGGGVMEACSEFILPTIERIVAEDKLPAAPSNRRIVLSQLGDDAVVLGAAALARAKLLQETDDVVSAILRSVQYPKITIQKPGVCTVGEQTFARSFAILPNGVPEIWSSKDASKKAETVAGTPPVAMVGTASAMGTGMAVPSLHSKNTKIHRGDLMRLCNGSVQLLVAASTSGKIEFTRKASEYLLLRGIELQYLVFDQAVKVFNESTKPRAGLFIIPEA